MTTSFSRKSSSSSTTITWPRAVSACCIFLRHQNVANAGVGNIKQLAIAVIAAVFQDSECGSIEVGIEEKTERTPAGRIDPCAGQVRIFDAHRRPQQLLHRPRRQPDQMIGIDSGNLLAWKADLRQ